MRIARVAAALAAWALIVTLLVTLTSTTAAAADVQVTVAGGRVTIVARDATIQQILTEWSLIGGTTFVNSENIRGGPMTLELTDVPERTALDVLLRSVSGYIVVAKPTSEGGGASQFERVLVLPTSSAPAPLRVPLPQFQASAPDFRPLTDDDLGLDAGARIVPAGAPAAKLRGSDSAANGGFTPSGGIARPGQLSPNVALDDASGRANAADEAAGGAAGAVAPAPARIVQSPGVERDRLRDGGTPAGPTPATTPGMPTPPGR